MGNTKVCCQLKQQQPLGALMAEHNEKNPGEPITAEALLRQRSFHNKRWNLLTLKPELCEVLLIYEMPLLHLFSCPSTIFLKWCLFSNYISFSLNFKCVFLGQHISFIFLSFAPNCHHKFGWKQPAVLCHSLNITLSWNFLCQISYSTSLTSVSYKVSGHGQTI